MTLLLTTLPQCAQNCNSHKPLAALSPHWQVRAAGAHGSTPGHSPGLAESKCFPSPLLPPSREKQMAACPLTHPLLLSLPFPVWGTPSSAGAERAAGFSAQTEPRWPHPGPHPACPAGRDNADVASCQQPWPMLTSSPYSSRQTMNFSKGSNEQ